MASYRFTNQENLEFLLLALGDYPLEIVGLSFGLSQGGDTKVELKIANIDSKTLEEVPGKSTRFRENITLSEKAAWRMDTLLKCCGVDVKPGEVLEFDPDERQKAIAEGKRFIDLRGLRGWGAVGHEPDKNNPQKKYNKVLTWYTNKQKLPKREYPPYDDTPATAPDEGPLF